MSSVIETKLINDDKRPIYGVLNAICSENKESLRHITCEFTLSDFKNKIETMIGDDMEPKLKRLISSERNMRRLIISLTIQELIEFQNQNTIKIIDYNLEKINKLYLSYNIKFFDK